MVYHVKCIIQYIVQLALQGWPAYRLQTIGRCSTVGIVRLTGILIKLYCIVLGPTLGIFPDNDEEV